VGEGQARGGNCKGAVGSRFEPISGRIEALGSMHIKWRSFGDERFEGGFARTIQQAT
jgi:hypothetical protein